MDLVVLTAYLFALEEFSSDVRIAGCRDKGREPVHTRKDTVFVFKNWNSWIIDIPGTYDLEVIEKLYKRNELAAGSFVALGQKIDLARLRLPTYLLAGSADEVVAPEQLLAVERLVGTQPECLLHEVAPVQSSRSVHWEADA